MVLFSQPSFNFEYKKSEASQHEIHARQRTGDSCKYEFNVGQSQDGSSTLPSAPSKCEPFAQGESGDPIFSYASSWLADRSSSRLFFGHDSFETRILSSGSWILLSVLNLTGGLREAEI